MVKIAIWSGFRMTYGDYSIPLLSRSRRRLTSLSPVSLVVINVLHPPKRSFPSGPFGPKV